VQRIRTPRSSTITHPRREDDTDKPDKLTEEERQQKGRTNRAGLDEYRTEGDVIGVRCTPDQPTPPTIPDSAPDHGDGDVPYAIIATRDGAQKVRLQHDARLACSSIHVGDYIEADGLKQTERQALAQRRQEDAETLERQRVMARISQEREALQLEILQVEARRRVAELEAEIESLQLSSLNEALRAYPLAAARQVQKEHLDVARALAGNTRAVLQIGGADEITRAFVVRDIYQGQLPDPVEAPKNGELPAPPAPESDATDAEEQPRREREG
jgi:hypothetical protein